VSIRLRLGPADIVSARFAISPLWEVGNAVRLLTRPELSGYHEPWLASVQPELDSVDLSAVMALHPPGAGWVPDFMTPPPRRVSPTVEQQLAEVAGTPLQLVTSELERTRPSQIDLAARAVIDELLADPAAGLARICAQLAEAWRVLVAPSWPRIRELVAADLAHRARIMAAHGFGAAVDDLHARVRWTGDAIAVQDPARVEHVVAGAGLILQPSAFSWPAVIVILDTGPAILVYPARGVAVLWRTGSVEAPVALARLLGRTRAKLLADLDEPRSTTALALRHGLGAPGVSGHLQALHASGLVVRRREGHEVRYGRTPLGEGLVAGGDGG
jgi:DNA-binding transcriptional ArsR family regulator